MYVIDFFRAIVGVGYLFWRRKLFNQHSPRVIRGFQLVDWPGWNQVKIQSVNLSSSDHLLYSSLDLPSLRASLWRQWWRVCSCCSAPSQADATSPRWWAARSTSRLRTARPWASRSTRSRTTRTATRSTSRRRWARPPSGRRWSPTSPTPTSSRACETGACWVVLSIVQVMFIFAFCRVDRNKFPSNQWLQPLLFTQKYFLRTEGHNIYFEDQFKSSPLLRKQK